MHRFLTILIAMMMVGCGAKIRFDDINGVWLHVTNPNANKLLNAKNQEWFTWLTNSCRWYEANEYTPYSQYSFEIKGQGDQIFYGQILGNKIYIQDESANLMSCDISESDANRIVDWFTYEAINSQTSIKLP